MGRSRTLLLVTSVFAFAFCAAASGPVIAQSYPIRPVKVIVPTPPGGPVDVMARLVAHELSETLGQNAFVENHPGAGNTIGSRMAANAEADGYTLLYSSASGLVISPLLYKNAGYTANSFVPIALVADSPLVLVVNPSVPAKSVKELIAYAKANPGKLNFSSGGVGVIPHLTGELFKAKTAINIVHVPYKGGGPSITGVMGGQVQMTFESLSVLLPLIRSGQLRALAVCATKRSPYLPDVPTTAEAGVPGVIASSWTGLLAPAKTPPSIVSKLNVLVNKALKSAEMQASLKKFAAIGIGGRPSVLTTLIDADNEKWRPIIKSLGLKRQ